MPELSMRTASPTDAGAIARVHRLSRADYYGATAVEDDDRESMWAHLVAEPERATYVAERSASLVGFISARQLPGSAGVLELTALYVLPTEYDRGIGSRLYDLFDGERGRGSEAVLEVWVGNARAIGFYVRRGWAPTGATRPGPQGIPFETYRLPADPLR